jgi:hypothetical protein
LELLELRSRLGARRDHALLRFVSFVKSEPSLLLNRAQRGAHRALRLPLHVGHALLGRVPGALELATARGVSVERCVFRNTAASGVTVRRDAVALRYRTISPLLNSDTVTTAAARCMVCT